MQKGTVTNRSLEWDSDIKNFSADASVYTHAEGGMQIILPGTNSLGAKSGLYFNKSVTATLNFSAIFAKFSPF